MTKIDELREMLARTLCALAGLDPSAPLDPALPGDGREWEPYEHGADAILAALDGAGLAVVPKEPTEAMIESAAKAMAWKYRDNGFYNLPDGSINPDPECESFRQMKIAKETPRWCGMARIAMEAMHRTASPFAPEEKSHEG